MVAVLAVAAVATAVLVGSGGGGAPERPTAGLSPLPIPPRRTTGLDAAVRAAGARRIS